MNKPNSTEDYQLFSSFYEVRKSLLNCSRERLERPLAYWALPSDRRLPLALLARPVNELINVPFDQLAATPGIGRKKIQSLVMLLYRAAQNDQVAFDNNTSEVCRAKHDGAVCTDQGFNAAEVSEAMWEQWKETVRHHNLGGVKLGRLAPALSKIPSVIWNTPLDFYLDHSLAEIRQMKTHGEKRVGAVLEVFWAVHRTLSATRNGNHLSLQLVPAFVARVEDWIASVPASHKVPDQQTVIDRLAKPLLDQIEIDGGSTIHELVVGRLGLKGARESVRSQSRRMGVTRARIYQLLDECAAIMSVRWPAGESKLWQLAAELTARNADAKCNALVNGLRATLFPTEDVQASQ